MRTVLLLFAIVTCLNAMVIAASPPDELPVLKTEVKTIAAFKNGLGFVFRSGQTDLKNGWTALDELPSASLGTLWFGTTTQPLRVDEVISSKGTVQREVDATNLSELLEANVGRRVKLGLVFGSNEPLTGAEGVIVSAPASRRPESSALESYRGSVSPGQIVMLKRDDGTILAIDKASVRHVELAGDSSLKARLTRDTDTAKIRLRGLGKGDEATPSCAEVTVAYLEKGITWSPSYLINIASDNKAEVTLEAVLANDVEDLDDADVSFVVGYPNFMYADFTTLLDARQSVAAFVQSLISGPSRMTGSPNGYGSVMAQSLAWSNVAGYDSERLRADVAYSAVAPMPGETNEDLYLYHRDHVTLGKGDRARYAVFTGMAPYKHIYQWEVTDTGNLDNRGYRRDGNDQKDPPDQVWHALKIENTTSQPWTTAPALVVNGSLPVAQDVLKYIPPGAKGTLKLTVATDVRAEQSQTELSRELVKIGYHDYDAVTVSGTLTVRNHKSKGISMDVKKVLTGEVVESGQGSKATRLAKAITAVNPQSQIEWEFEIPAGGSQELTYTYKTLVAR